jgi:spore germination cell wall hydrolase CwlJ-like protein
VTPELRLLAALSALALLSATPAAGRSDVPVIQLGAMLEPQAPAVFVSIPKYRLDDTERETVAACLILEAASQGDFGMRGVMSVIRNRSRALPELFVTTVLRPRQFSAFNRFTAGRESLAQLIARARHDPMWPVALAIVDDATHQAWHDSTGGATHYTLSGERTRWTRSLVKTVTIGAHSFYR